MIQIRQRRKLIATIAAISLLLLLLCMPTIVFYIRQKNLIALSYTLMIPLFVFLIPLIIFRRIVKWYAAFLGIIILLAPLATFPVIYFGNLVSANTLVITFNTSYREASELMAGYIPAFVLIYIVYLTLGILAIFWLPSKVSFRRSALISVIALFSMVSITALRFGITPTVHEVGAMVSTSSPFHLLHAGYVFYKEQSLVKKSEKYIHNFHFNQVAGTAASQRQIYILLIGETSRYDHWGINGYSRPTTPLLTKQTRLINYRNAVSAGCITELAVPQILTGVTANHYDEHLRRAGVIRLFHQAGFKTYWLSSQTDKGNIRMHSSLADSIIWVQNNTLSKKHLHYDMELINQMDTILKKDTGNCFIVIHTLGSHFNYTSRYPSAFQQFQPVWTSPSIPSVYDKPKLINAYDNTILYTDAVLDSAISVLNSFNSISALLYTSDHGENLFDDARNLIFHPPSPPSKYIAHIPFLIYCSQEYVQQFPVKWKYLNKHKCRKISNNQTLETLADMAGIKYEGQNKNNSIASPTFTDSPQKVLGPNNKVYPYSKLK